MKRQFLGLLAAVCLLIGLPGCGTSGEVIDYDLVFVNDSDSTIVEVVMQFADQSSGARRADSCPMKQGETFGFEAGEYPVTVLVYDKAVGRVEKGELARTVIDKAPPEGERWYVAARDGGNGLVLAADTRWPLGE